MFQPASELFTKREKVALQDADIKYCAQEYLRRALQSDGVYCQSVEGGRVVVRANTPLLFQEVRMCEYDLAQYLKKEASYAMRELKVVQ